MPLFKVKSLSQSCSLPDAAAGHRAARRVGQFRVGEQAVYLPGFPGTRYIPYDAVSRAWTKKTSVTVAGGCGKALPMIRLRMFYDGETYQDFLFEKLEEADAVLDALAAARPEVPLERETALGRTI